MLSVWIKDRTLWEKGVGVELLVKDYHHLIHVLRAKEGEEVLVITEGNMHFHTRLESLTKNRFTLRVLDCREGREKFEEKGGHLYPRINWVCGIGKKQAMEEIIQAAVSLEIQNVYFVPMEYGDKSVLSEERVESLIQGALIQSRSVLLPNIRILTSFEKFVELLPDMNMENNQQHWILAHLDTEIFFHQNNPPFVSQEKHRLEHTLVVGPAGGFSRQDLESFHKLFESRKESFEYRFLPVGILRAPLALSVFTGTIWQNFLSTPAL